MYRSSVKNYMSVHKKDGYPLISKDELGKTEFDYLIIAVGEAYDQEAKNEALSLGIPRPCLKNVKTPRRRIFFHHTALNIFAGRQPACKNLP